MAITQNFLQPRSSSDWASPVDGYVSFDNFRVSQTSLLESSTQTKSDSNIGMYLGTAIGSLFGCLCVVMVCWELAQTWKNNSDVNDLLIETDADAEAEERRVVRPS